MQHHLNFFYYFIISIWLLICVNGSWASQNYLPTFKTQFYSFSYATPREGANHESRYHLSLKKICTPLGWDYAYHLDVWGLIPREAQDWFDVTEAYVRFSGVTSQYKIGRILPNWGHVNDYSPLEQIFPKFSIDPLTNQRDGILGGQASYTWGPFELEALISPLFIPDRGGFRYKKEGAHFYIPSRWGPSLQYRVKIGETWVPLDYDLAIPDLGKIVWKPAGLLRAQCHLGDAILGGTVGHTPRPEARTRMEGKIHFVDESSLATRVTLFPEFLYQDILGIDWALGWKGILGFGEALYVKHENSMVTPYLPPEMKYLAGLKISLSDFLQTQWVSGMTVQQNLKAEILSTLSAIKKAPLILFSGIEISPLHAFRMKTFLESNRSMTDSIFRQSLDVNVTRSFWVGIGADLLKGDDGSYWGQFRTHDRMWVRVEYEI